MMTPELNFVYYSFKTLSSYQICFLEGEVLKLRSFETDKIIVMTLNDLKQAFETKQMREDKRQNEYLRILNMYNNTKK